MSPKFNTFLLPLSYLPELSNVATSNCMAVWKNVLFVLAGCLPHTQKNLLVQLLWRLGESVWGWRHPTDCITPVAIDSRPSFCPASFSVWLDSFQATHLRAEREGFCRLPTSKEDSAVKPPSLAGHANPSCLVLPRHHQDASGPQCHAPHTAPGIGFVISFLFVSLEQGLMCLWRVTFTLSF